jgi:hypothetical protein
MTHGKRKAKEFRRGAMRRKLAHQNQENQQFELDSKAAEERPSQLTPLQIMRLQRSEMIRAKIAAEKEKKNNDKA